MLLTCVSQSALQSLAWSRPSVSSTLALSRPRTRCSTSPTWSTSVEFVSACSGMDLLLLLGSYTRISCTLIKVKIVSGYNDTPHSLSLPHHISLFWMNELTNKWFPFLKYPRKLFIRFYMRQYAKYAIINLYNKS